MPAPKAVLRDIHELGLDPTVAHSRIASNGRLGHAAATAPAVKSALVKLPEEKKPAPKVETKPEKKAEPVKVEAPKAEEKAEEKAPEPKKEEPVKAEAKKAEKKEPTKVAEAPPAPAAEEKKDEAKKAEKPAS